MHGIEQFGRLDTHGFLDPDTGRVIGIGGLGPAPFAPHARGQGGYEQCPEQCNAHGQQPPLQGVVPQRLARGAGVHDQLQDARTGNGPAGRMGLDGRQRAEPGGGITRVQQCAVRLEQYPSVGGAQFQRLVTPLLEYGGQ